MALHSQPAISQKKKLAAGTQMLLGKRAHANNKALLPGFRTSRATAGQRRVPPGVAGGPAAPARTGRLVGGSAFCRPSFGIDRKFSPMPGKNSKLAPGLRFPPFLPGESVGIAAAPAGSTPIVAGLLPYRATNDAPGSRPPAHLRPRIPPGGGLDPPAAGSNSEIDGGAELCKLTPDRSIQGWLKDKNLLLVPLAEGW